MQWISVLKWRQFQHYDPAKRQPPWIKNYTELLHMDEYLDLTAGERSVLHGIWLEYASSQCQLKLDTRSLSRRLNLRVTSRHLEALNGAGFIGFVASAALAEGYQRATTETETETKTETKTETEGSTALESPSPKEARPAQQNGHEPETDEHPDEHPYLKRLLTDYGTTHENTAKLRRAAQGKTEAAIVIAYEASKGPGVNDPIAVALSELGKSSTTTPRETGANAA